MNRVIISCAAIILCGGLSVTATGASASPRAATPAVTLAPSYSMTFDNFTIGVTSTGFLTDTPEADSGFSGQMTVNPPLYGTTGVSGTVSSDNITFTGDEAGFGDENFTGTVSTVTGKMSGTYDDPDISQNGTWTAVPDLVLAVLGDSYSSGEGAGNYLPGTNSPAGCRRSLNAWGFQLGSLTGALADMPSTSYLLACSGAESDALFKPFKGQEPQAVTALANLESGPPGTAPTLITLTMGGNDLGFASVIADCYFYNCVTDGTIERVEKQLPAEQTQLTSDYEAVYGVTAVPADVLVVGYPQIFEQYEKCQGLGDLGPGFSIDEEEHLNALTVDVDNTIQKAVTQADDVISSEDGDTIRPVHYVSALDALSAQGHQMCTAQPWVVEAGIEQNFTDSQAQAHPNALGQTAIAKIVADYIKDNFSGR